MDAQQLKGLAVITLNEAERVGRVEDVLFETEPLRAAALRLQTDTGARLVALSDIRTVGADAIITDDRASTEQHDAVLNRRQLPGLEDLRRLNVVGEDGRHLGHVGAVDVDPATGAVAGREIRKGEMLGLGGESRTLTPDQIISVGREIITVRAA